MTGWFGRVCRPRSPGADLYSARQDIASLLCLLSTSSHGIDGRTTGPAVSSLSDSKLPRRSNHAVHHHRRGPSLPLQQDHINGLFELTMLVMTCLLAAQTAEEQSLA